MIWTPDSAQIDSEREALIERHLHQHIAEGAALERELRRLDPYLRVVFIGERAPDLPDILPGRWHVQRKNPDAIDSYFSIATPDGGYLEPSFQIIEEMKRADLWKPGAMEELSKKRSAEKDRKSKAVELEAEQRRDQMAESYRAAKRVSGDGGMTKRAWGKGLVNG